MSDDPARTLAFAAAADGDEVIDGQAAARPWVQITEGEGTRTDAGDVLERADAFGRVPVVVRIRRQPPIRLEWVLIAVGLGASGLLLPVFLALRAIIIVAAVVALLVGLMARIFMRIPPGSVGLVARAARPIATLEAGVHRVNPALVLTHVVTTRELAFDVPVSEARSAEGVNIGVDLLLTLHLEDQMRMVYSITTGDLDQLIHATCQDAVRTLVRETAATAALDLGPEAATRLREQIDGRIGPYGVRVRDVAFTRIRLPAPLTGSMEARRLAGIQLEEEEAAHVLAERRLANRADLTAQEQEARRTAVEAEASVEDLRLAKLEARLTANPAAARYDLEVARLRVAQDLAGNSRAVVSMGGGDLVANLLLAREADGGSAPPPADARAAGPVTRSAGRGNRPG
jgi:regulator of protease activity HflC (stomatin/prohibitin superfamily)